MKKEFIPLIGFDEKKTWMFYVPLFVLRIISFKLYARKWRMLYTEWFKKADLSVDDFKIVPREQ